ncbi:MAG: polysaccharide deacetylase family protein [Kofleriaceae bacterium]
MLAVGACQAELGELDSAFYNGDGRRVHCAVGVDTDTHNSLASIDTALDRAAERAETVELYAHVPGRTVPVSVLEYVVAGASARGLAFVTYADFARNEGRGPAIALSLDDSSIAEWFALRSLFQTYSARVTLFLSHYQLLTSDELAMLSELAADGHDIAAHSVWHYRAPEYVEQAGLTTYLNDEVLPSIDRLRAAGYDVTSFAYPFGARTSELDHAILQRVPIVRSIVFSYTGIVTSPCPD